ncbi:MAG: alkaline phosphatase D family protein [Myxococcota bacterium]
MTIGRRSWLRRVGLGVGGSVALIGCGDDDGEPTDGGIDAGADMGVDMGVDMGPPAPEVSFPEALGDAFQHGVASGDPLADAVILWTRVTTTEERVPVAWTIATDPGLTDVVASGTAVADAAADHTVKVDATGLSAATTYYYQFATGTDQGSLIGRTRTAPSGASDRLRFGVVSCSSLAHGYFHAYRHLAERADLDAVIHCGDYIYEYGNGEYGDVRDYEPPTEIVSLADYRMRYAQYRRDPDLQAVHQQHPFLTVWDDHESTNDSYVDGAENHQDGEGDWEERKAIAFQVYLEWMPIRDTGEPLRIWRELRYGDLADFFLLDTRLWGRTVQQRATSPAFGDEARTLLGTDQEAWLAERLEASSARWKILVQQVMVGQFVVEGPSGTTPASPSFDDWASYPAARTRLLDLIEPRSDVVVLTGDIHSHWANDLPRDGNDPGDYDPETGAGSLAVEFVCSSVTSPALDEPDASTALRLIQEANPALRYGDFTQRGYVAMELDAARAQADYFVLDGILAGEGVQTRARSFSCATGAARLVEETDGLADVTDAPALAPGAPERDPAALG